MEHPSKPVVTWPLKEHTLTGGNSWLQIAARGRIVTTLRGREEIEALRAGLRRITGNTGGRHFTAWFAPAKGGIEAGYLSCDGSTDGRLVTRDGSSLLCRDTCVDLERWLFLCCCSRPHVHAPAHEGTETIALHPEKLCLSVNGQSVSVPVDHAHLSPFLLGIVARERVGTASLALRDGAFITVHGPGTPSDSHLLIAAQLPDVRMQISVGRGELAHLALTSHDIARQVER